jgi:hypothetical protein
MKIGKCSVRGDSVDKFLGDKLECRCLIQKHFCLQREFRERCLLCSKRGNLLFQLPHFMREVRQTIIGVFAWYYSCYNTHINITLRLWSSLLSWKALNVETLQRPFGTVGARTAHITLEFSTFTKTASMSYQRSRWYNWSSIDLRLRIARRSLSGVLLGRLHSITLGRLVNDAN